MLNFELRFAAGSGVGNRMKNVLLQMLIWFSCTTLRSKNDRSAFDLFALCPGIKSGFVKFCKAHELRIRTLLLTFRVIRGNFELMLRMSKSNIHRNLKPH
jgi:hypothetical protein